MRLAAFLLIFSLFMIAPAISIAQTETQSEDTPAWEGFTFNLENLDGENMSEEDVFTDGTLYLVDFWASWCRPCAQYLPHLEDMVNDYGDQGFKVIIFCVDEAGTVSTARSTLNGADYPFTILFDTESEVKGDLGAQRIPTTIIFNAQGDELWRHVGYSSGNEEDVRAKVEELLPDSSASAE